MYKVYRDPEGLRSLDSSDKSDSYYVMIIEESYQKRIENLNSEIKALTEELTVVCLYCKYCTIVTEFDKTRFPLTSNVLTVTNYNLITQQVIHPKVLHNSFI